VSIDKGIAYYKASLEIINVKHMFITKKVQEKCHVWV